MPVDASKMNRSRPSVTTSLRDGRGGDERCEPALSRLRSPTTPGRMTPPSSCAALRGSEAASPVTVSMDASMRLAPTVASLAQESVSVMVRLKGPLPAPPATPSGPAAGSGRVSPPVSLPPSSPGGAASPPPLLAYAVGDGSFKTPRTGRGRPSASHGSGALSPLSHLDASLGSGDVWQAKEEHHHHHASHSQQQQQGTSSAQGSPLAASDSPLPPSAMLVSLPKAFTAVPAATGLTPLCARPLSANGRASPVSAGASTTTAATAAAASPVPNTPLPVHGSTGSSIGTRGRLLTLHSPASDECRQYEFGEVFEPDVTNAALCERMLPAIMEQLRASYNVCVVCYGQTGTGKTYTMNALVPAVANELFRSLDVDNEVVEISYVQIYNNKAYNLLEGARGGKFGAELSKLPQANTDSSSGSSSYGPPEPKALVRSAAEVAATVRAAARLRVTHAHALNPRSSRSFTLLTLHVTRFLDGAPLTTTRVTLADLAGTERLKKSGATGEGQSQAIFINKSLMALRELVESSGGESEVRHFRDSLLTTHLAPRMRSWHLFLLVTVSLEVASFDETKSSLEFATNARRRRIRKLRSRTADRLSGAAGRLCGVQGGGGSGGRGSTADAGAEAEVSELQAVVEALHFRIRVLEASLTVAQRQREVLDGLCTPPRSPARQPEVHHGDSGRSNHSNHSNHSSGSGGSSERVRQSDAEIGRLRQECRHYRLLLREREEDLRSWQAQVPPESGSALLLSPRLDEDGSLAASAHAAAHSASHGNGVCVCEAEAEASSSGAPFRAAPSSSSLSNSITAGDESALAAAAAAAAMTEDSSSFGGGNGHGSAAAEAAGGVADDVHAQLLHGVLQLCHTTADPDGAQEDLYDVALRAKEQADDVRERLLVVTASLRGLRAQNHQLHDRLLHANRTVVHREEQLRHKRELLAAERVRACVAETAADDLRLRLFRALAEQPIIEELTRLYLDEQPSPEAVDVLSGTQLAEHREELEKFETHQRALQDKITELVNTVEVLSRSGAQKDMSLETLESIITPAQRALFHTMSTTRTSSEEVLRQSVADAQTGESGADCFSLLQSRVSELELLVQQDRQQQQVMTCELMEAREDARRSRQEQRQAFYQQQEEERRVAQLSVENFDLRQHNERHQLYLDQVHVHFQEQLLELRRYHVVEMAEQRRRLEEAFLFQQQQQQQQQDDVDGAAHEEEEEEEEEGAMASAAADDGAARVFRQTSTRRGTSHGPQRTSNDWTVEDTARGWGGHSGGGGALVPLPHQRADTLTEEWRQSAASTPPQRRPTTSAAKASSSGRRHERLRGKERRLAKAHPKKGKGKTAAVSRARQEALASASPNSQASAHTHAFVEGGRRSLVLLNTTQPPATPARPSPARTSGVGTPRREMGHTGRRVS